MWHEARRQERKIRKAIVDYKKRSERRHQYYEKIKQDPTKFLQVHGRKCKIHLDGTVAAEADNNNHMMPWLGDNSNLIDRFDVRTHLDYIQDVSNTNDEEISSEERKCNFERYRVLIWNEYKKIPEHQHLKQIYVDEQFPAMSSQQKQNESQKQMLAQSKAKIGYDYDENDRSWNSNKGTSQYSNRGKAADDFSDDEDDFDIMEELEEIPPLSEISMDAITAMDEIGAKKYKLTRGSFGDCLVDDQNYMDQVSAAKDIESERRRFSGRKSRRERRLLKDERLKGREIGVLSYVRQDSSETSDSSDSGSSSSNDSSSSSGDSEAESAGSSKQKNQIEYITSFGEDVNASKGIKHDKPPKRPTKKAKRSKSYSSSPRRSRSRSPIRHTKYSGYSRRRSRSRSRGRYDRHRRRSRDRRSRSSSSSDSSYSREHRKSSDRRRHRGEGTAKIMPTQQSTDSLIKSLSKHKSAEEKAAAIKKLTPQQKLKIRMQRALNKQLKVDRHAVLEKKMEKQQQIIEREDDLREISRKIRRREFAHEDTASWDNEEF